MKITPPPISEPEEKIVNVEAVNMTDGYVILEGGRVIPIARYLGPDGLAVADRMEAVVVVAGEEGFGYIEIEVLGIDPVTIH